MKNKEMVENIEILLSMKRHPIGVKFLYTQAEFEAIDVPALEGTMAYCTMVRNAMNNQRFKVNEKNFACLTAARALGLLPMEEAIASGRVHAKMKVYKDIAVSKDVITDMIYRKKEAYGALLQPLSDYETMNPDVVIMVTNPYNAMRLIQGHAYHHGQVKNIKMAGMQAICQECTSYPFERDQLNVSMLCSGTRKVAQWEEDEMALGFPYHLLASIVDGVAKTVNPMEPNKGKRDIEKKKGDRVIDGLEVIEYNKNYYTGAYKGRKYKRD